MKLHDYLGRVGFSGEIRPTPEALGALLRCHVLRVPFENLDVQLGIPVSMEAEVAYDKIVTRKRGGWCYEQNGLFGWALSEIGFDVTRVAAAVHRAERGDAALANHLCLIVRTPDDSAARYLADVGFGGSMIRPMRLDDAEDDQSPFRLGLQRLEDGWWRFTEAAGDDSVAYDFEAEPAVESELAAKCVQLQTDPEASFVLNLVTQKRTPDTHISLRGRVLTTLSAKGKETTLLQSPDEFIHTLRNIFRLDVREAGELWPKVLKRHEVLFG